MNERKKDGAAPDGAAPDGAAPDGAAPDGAAAGGATPDRTATAGAAPDGAATPDAARADSPAAPDADGARVPRDAGDPIAETGVGWFESLIEEGAVLGIAGIPEGTLSDPALPGIVDDFAIGRPEPESLRKPGDAGGSAGPPRGEPTARGEEGNKPPRR